MEGLGVLIFIIIMAGKVVGALSKAARQAKENAPEQQPVDLDDLRREIERMMGHGEGQRPPAAAPPPVQPSEIGREATQPLRPPAAPLPPRPMQMPPARPVLRERRPESVSPPSLGQAPRPATPPPTPPKPAPMRPAQAAPPPPRRPAQAQPMRPASPAPTPQPAVARRAATPADAYGEHARQAATSGSLGAQMSQRRRPVEGRHEVVAGGPPRRGHGGVAGVPHRPMPFRVNRRIMAQAAILSEIWRPPVALRTSPPWERD